MSDYLNSFRLRNKEKINVDQMDESYIELMAMDEAYMLVPGLRRKCDVARRIIETTRGDVTQEVRREALENRLKKLEKTRRKHDLEKVN